MSGATTTHSSTKPPLREDPEVEAKILDIKNAPTPEVRLAKIDDLRDYLDMPDGGTELRAWLRFQLQRIYNPKAKRNWTQADIGRAVGSGDGASGTTVSRVFMGELQTGDLSDEVRALTARLLFGEDSEDSAVDYIWRPTATCEVCGNPLSAGDHDTRGASLRAVRRSPSNNPARAARGATRARSPRPGTLTAPGAGRRERDAEREAEREAANTPEGRDTAEGGKAEITPGS